MAVNYNIFALNSLVAFIAVTQLSFHRPLKAEIDPGVRIAKAPRFVEMIKDYVFGMDL